MSVFIIIEMCLNCDKCVTIWCINIHMIDIISILILLSLPFGIVGWYILLNDPTDNRSMWKKFHSLMKAGRLNKVVKKIT